MVFILILTIVISSGGVYAEGLFESIGSGVDKTITITLKSIKELVNDTINKFNDIKGSEWFINQVSKLVGIGGIDGYPDGTFKPNNTINRGEFTKILVSIFGHKNLPKTTSHWASGYISKAEELGLIDKDEFKDADKVITRNEMAKMAANSLNLLGEKHITDREDYKELIKDYNNVSEKYKDFVLKVYAKGIITGFPDGTFGGEKGLTRAEASSVIIRVIDETERKVPPKPSKKEYVRREMPKETGPNVDLKLVPIYGEGIVDIYPVDHHASGDFGYTFITYKEMDDQYRDAENLLTVRFGKDNKTVKEIMNYLKSGDDLAQKTWTINKQLIRADFSPGMRCKGLTVWRPH